MNAAGAPERLLAKGLRHGRPVVTLERHSLDTEEAAVHLFGLDSRWGQNWCRFFRIAECEHERFLLNLRIACLFHDLGKGNEDFYRMVAGTSQVQQTLRHEHLSALFLHLPDLRSWLSTCPALDLEVITAAVLSHHLKANLDGDWKWCQPRGTRVLTLYLDHPEVHRILQRVKDITGLSPPPALPKVPWSAQAPWAEAYRDGRRAAKDLGGAIRRGRDPARLALLLAIKAGVIAADSASSGLVREGRPIATWITEVVGQPAITAGEIFEKIILPRTTQIERKLGRPFDFHAFQLRAAAQGSRALLLAACGSGKTLAAWKWAEAQAHSYCVGKVVFLYPTRGTATEGFRDYVGWAPEADAALMHGTSKYELEGMAANPSEATEGKQYCLSEADARLYALGFWSKRFFSATVDQFLSFMEHSYASLCLLPVLADSVVIVDEVHSFDRRMFNDLVAFLQTFDVPVLCMTATLPPSRRDDLEAAGLHMYPDVSDRVYLSDLEAQETHPRYRLKPVASSDEALAQAVAAYRAGKRVLWVVNQVARCQTLAARLREELQEDVLCYHSRFRLRDRQKRHQATVEAFKQSQRPAIAVTTQVCEMSLDLDADVLITEIAKVTSLVQRFGRANRRPITDPSFRATVHTYEPTNHRPYSREEINAARAFLTELGCSEVSQRTLAESLERHAPGEARADGSGAFLEGGYFATPASFRDADDFAQPCVLDGDFARIAADRAAGLAVDGWIVSVPRRQIITVGARPAWLADYLGVARSDRYSEELGFLTDDGAQS